ncbi:DUF58 domain-containing protein [Ruficoccus amylovorans]|uniref:DUF58 domain-containing protein n=1 Tax=Ruficoccus amylovorans TaxID=1804625 RepID=A0A842HDV1_9BACT|nr:DUF58 domain-containing protein [Ruficoccus amylovorans]MBC2594409.1 DUF58 domain-containing protein [Ruficoccus amylovorans]
MTIGERLAQAKATKSLAALISESEALAGQFRLPFNRQNWRGQTGNWAGAGIGSSIDFQDHRPYVPGDDPRYINWQAYARSGHYTMKLYREEVRPQVDLVLDLSASMFVEPAKAVRALEVFYLACHSAWRNAALLNVFLTAGGEVLPTQQEALRAGDWTLPPPGAATESLMDWRRIPWSTRSMRVVVSDFLFDQDPEAQLADFARSGSSIVLLCVHTRAEAAPGWLGNVELLDCETDRRVHRYFTREDIDRYRLAYDGHFSRWTDAAARHAASFSRIDADASLTEQLLALAGPRGGVELCT